MSKCGFPTQYLQAWLDGEGGKRAALTRDHLEHCRSCANLVDAWRRAGDQLRNLVDAELSEVDPLVGLERIRERIAAAQSRTLGARLTAWWQDVWLFHRRALAGVAVAVALGALAAPGVVFLLGKAQMMGPTGPAVVVESLEVGGNSTAVVLGDEGGTTTLIWVEPGADESYEESF